MRTYQGVIVPESRESLRVTFDRAAASYQDARPDYPDELFDRLIERTGVTTGSDLLEIGPATGKATLPLARRGFRITAVEPGPALAARARRNLAEFPDVCIVGGEFETTPVGREFDLVFAATAWHWIDPGVRVQRAWECLRPGGHLAVWSATHVFPENGDPFFDELQPVYEEIGEGLPADARRPRPGALPEDSAEIIADGRFQNVTSDQFDWEIRYDADGYLALLNTFSGHLAMEPWQRRRLYAAIRDGLARRPDGMLRRHWGCVLLTAQRVTTPG